MFEERPVHETIVFDGASSTLDFDLIHHAYPTLEDYLEHMDRYSTLGAQLLVSPGPHQPHLCSPSPGTSSSSPN